MQKSIPLQPSRRAIRYMTKSRPGVPAARTGPEDAVYAEDFVAWVDRQADLLRAGKLDGLDRANLAEELEDMGKAKRQELRSRLEILLTHLLKYQHQPDMRSGSWRGTIGEQRRRIEDVIEESPSLRSTLAALLEDPKLYRHAVQQALLETGLSKRVFPETNPYGAAALDAWFWPGVGPHPDIG